MKCHKSSSINQWPNWSQLASAIGIPNSNEEIPLKSEDRIDHNANPTNSKNIYSFWVTWYKDTFQLNSIECTSTIFNWSRVYANWFLSVWWNKRHCQPTVPASLQFNSQVHLAPLTVFICMQQKNHEQKQKLRMHKKKYKKRNKTWLLINSLLTFFAIKINN